MANSIKPPSFIKPIPVPDYIRNAVGQTPTLGVSNSGAGVDSRTRQTTPSVPVPMLILGRPGLVTREVLPVTSDAWKPAPTPKPPPPPPPPIKPTNTDVIRQALMGRTARELKVQARNLSTKLNTTQRELFGDNPTKEQLVDVLVRHAK
jgi:hypothetical protein